MKKIEITGGREILVDKIDYDAVSQYKWHYCAGYARRQVRVGPYKQRGVLMHREIMNAPSGTEVDHINGDGLDNRRENLRLATRSQNCANKEVYSSKSGYRGVHKSWNRWSSAIKHNGNRYDLGRFDTPEDAARAYNEAAKKYHGEFARLNDV